MRRAAFAVSVASMLTACQAEPRLVYVPAGEPQVELMVSASATEVSVDEPVILHAERRSRGEWKKVERSSLGSDQCWLGSPPPVLEREVADNLRWEALPAGGARFNVVYREDRTRELVFLKAGTFTLESSSAIWCSPNNAKGRPIKFLVRDKMKSGTNP